MSNSFKCFISIILLYTIILCCFSSCNPNITVPPNLETQQKISSEDTPTIKMDSNPEAVKTLAQIHSDFHCSCISTNRSKNVFTLNDAIYIVSGNPNSQEIIHELNLSTGNFQKICRDPLCDHSRIPCVEAYYYIAQIITDEDIYILGEYMKNKNEGRKFIGMLDLLSGTVEILHEWLPSSSANSLSFEYNNGYLYYTKATSDTTNEIFRFSVTTKKEEKVSSLNEYIVVFALSDDGIYFRDNYNIMKKASMDFAVVETLDDGVSIIFPLDDKLYYFKNAYTSNGEAAGFNMMCMDKTTLETTTVLTNTYNPSMTLYDQGAFYYTGYNYPSDKTVYVYNVNSAQTKSYTIGRGSRCDVLGVLDHILILKLYTDFDPSTGQRDTEYYLFDTTNNQMVQIYCE